MLLHSQRLVVGAQRKGVARNVPTRDVGGFRPLNHVAPPNLQRVLVGGRALVPAVLVVERPRCAHGVAVVDGLGHIPPAVPALVVSAGGGDDQIARLLLDRRVAEVPEVEQLNRDPCRHVPHELAARVAGRGVVRVQQTLFEPLGVVRVDDDPELWRAGVQIVQRVEITVLDVQGERRGAIGAGDIQIGRVDAGRAFAGGRRQAATVPF